MNLFDEIKGREMYIIVIERDTRNPMEATGSIVWETYVNKSDIAATLERRNKLGQYGQNVICKLVPLSVDEIKAISAAESK